MSEPEIRKKNLKIQLDHSHANVFIVRQIEMIMQERWMWQKIYGDKV